MLMVVIAATEGDLIKGLMSGRITENRCMRVNMNRTTVVITGEWQKAARWPCCVCGCGNNSTQCTSCQNRIQKKYNGIKGSMSVVMKSFIVRGCVNPVQVT